MVNGENLRTRGGDEDTAKDREEWKKRISVADPDCSG